MGMTSSSRSGVMNEINVTPLVDVMLVLLIIFMVTAPLMQQGLEVDLPETKGAGVETSEDPFVLVIKKNGQIFAGTAVLPMANVSSKMAAIFKQRKNKQVYIQADRYVAYGVVAEVMAEVKSAGIHNISLVTLPKTK